VAGHPEEDASVYRDMLSRMQMAFVTELRRPDPPKESESGAE